MEKTPPSVGKNWLKVLLITTSLGVAAFIGFLNLSGTRFDGLTQWFTILTGKNPSESDRPFPSFKTKYNVSEKSIEIEEKALNLGRFHVRAAGRYSEVTSGDLSDQAVPLPQEIFEERVTQLLLKTIDKTIQYNHRAEKAGKKPTVYAGRIIPFGQQPHKVIGQGTLNLETLNLELNSAYMVFSTQISVEKPAHLSEEQFAAQRLVTLQKFVKQSVERIKQHQTGLIASCAKTDLNTPDRFWKIPPGFTLSGHTSSNPLYLLPAPPEPIAKGLEVSVLKSLYIRDEALARTDTLRHDAGHLQEMLQVSIQGPLAEVEFEIPTHYSRYEEALRIIRTKCSEAAQQVATLNEEARLKVSEFRQKPALPSLTARG